MICEDSYSYLVDYLSGLLENTTVAGGGMLDKGVSKRFEAELCDMFERYVCSPSSRGRVFAASRSGKLFAYNGKYYEELEPTDFEQVVKRVMSRIGVSSLYQKNSHGIISRECVGSLSSCTSSEFRPDRNYVAFGNGVLDLSRGELLPFGGMQMTDLHLDFPYDPCAASALWDTKLAEIVPDPGMREALQSFFGCLLVDRGEFKIEYVCFILGTGGNGKSVLVDAVANTFGPALFSRFSPDQLFRSQQSMFNLAALEGKLANFCDDVSNKDFSGGDFKSFVSGAEFEARLPYGRSFFKVKAPLMVCCANEMPPTTDDSEGFHRRFLVITTCERTWSGAEKDPELTRKLASTESRQAIFNWVLGGYRRVVGNRGEIPIDASVAAAARLVREESSSARRWVRDAGLVAVVPDGLSDPRWRKMTEWYALYRKYCEDNGERYPQKANSVGRLFRQLGFSCARRSEGMWYCVGYADLDLAPGGGPGGGLEEDFPF